MIMTMIKANNENEFRDWTTRGWLLIALLCGLLFLAGCGGGSGGDIPVTAAGVLSGKVTAQAGFDTRNNGVLLPVANATVYLVPVDKVRKTKITAAGVLDGTAEAYDEPLEDAMRVNAIADSKFAFAVTDSQGSYSMSNLPSGKFYVYVDPPAPYLPGGDACRVSRDLPGTLNISLSGMPPTTATYTGSASCVGCHKSTHAGHKFTAHKLGISVPNAPNTTWRSTQNYPSFDLGLAAFQESAAYDPTKATVLSFGDFDDSRGFDDFKVYVKTAGAGGALPSQITTESGELHLWKNTTNGQFTITLVNTADPTDPNSPVHLEVGLTYGGTVYKQRYLVKIPASLAAGRVGVYPLLQFQSYPGISDGTDTHFDRGRATYRDYHLDWYYNGTTNLITAPKASKNFGGTCAGCHIPGMKNLGLNTAGEALVKGVEDVNNEGWGVYDWDNDGFKEESNVGCESCHGPGSVHVGGDHLAKDIVSPGKLTPSRETMICGSCHDRGTGKGNAGHASDVLYAKSSVSPTDPLSDRMFVPGLSRTDVVTNYMTRKGPKSPGHFHADQTHSIKHHQHYADLLKSDHYRNDRELVTCSNCHDLHAKRTLAGEAEHPHQLTESATALDDPLCMKCHAIDKAAHMLVRTGSTHAGTQTNCIACHMPRTAKTGAGIPGLSFEGGAAKDSTNSYWNNDISAHTFLFIPKSAVGVTGVAPGSAMPAPYTNACGTCHDPSSLKDQIAVPSTSKGRAQL
jgi:hypothetical protein